MTIAEILTNVQNKNWTYQGQPVKLWIVDELPLSGMDTVRVNVMFEDKEVDTIHKDSYMIDRSLFERDLEAAAYEFQNMMHRFVERIETYREHGDFECDEIEI